MSGTWKGLFSRAIAITTPCVGLVPRSREGRLNNTLFSCKPELIARRYVVGICPSTRPTYPRISTAHTRADRVSIVQLHKQHVMIASGRMELQRVGTSIPRRPNLPSLIKTSSTAKLGWQDMENDESRNLKSSICSRYLAKLDKHRFRVAERTHRVSRSGH